MQLKLVYEVSQITSSGLPVDDAIAEIAAAALKATRAVAVVIEDRSCAHSRPVRIYTEEKTWSVSDRNEIPNQLPRSFRSLFISPLQYGGRRFGEIHLYLSGPSLPRTALVDLTVFLGQQIAGFLHRADLMRKRNQLRLTVARTRDEIATRKAFDRAAGIVARRSGIPVDDAEMRLRDASRKANRSLLAVANDVIERSRKPLRRRPPQRRIA